MVAQERFEFPPLGDTGAGPVIHVRRQGETYWQDGSYGVSLQWDHPACAFRCHYPGGSAPCDQETALRFIQWAKAKSSTTN